MSVFLRLQRNPIDFISFFNELAAKLGSVDAIFSVKGYASAGMVIGSVFSTCVKCHPFYSNVPLISFEVLDRARIDTDSRAFWTLCGLTHIHNWSDMVVIYDNSWRGWSELESTDPFLVQNEELARIIQDLTANIPQTKTLNVKKKVWEGFGFDREFGNLDKKKPDVTLMSGKFLDFRRDLTSLIPHSYANKYSLLSNFHPTKPVNNAHELVDDSFAYLTSELKYPTYGEIGALFLGHRVQVTDVSRVVRDRISERLLYRQFTFNPEIHSVRGIVFGYLGISWQDLPLLVDLYERGKRYAEQYIDEIFPDLFEKFVRELSVERTGERVRKKREEFRRVVERTFFVKYKRKRKKIIDGFLKELDEDIRKKVENILKKKVSNNLSSIWERETKTPNPFSAIIQEVNSI